MQKKPPKFKDLTRLRFERLIVEKNIGRDENGHILWECQCDCGNKTIASSRNLLAGDTKSCGCLQKEYTGLSGKTHGMAGSKLYSIWNSMIQRCHNKKNSNYKNYGYRGIHVCSLWKTNASVFLTWALQNGYKQGLTIERFNNGKGYNPDNCSFVLRSINNTNKRVYAKSKTGYAGITTRYGKFQARISFKKQFYNIGTYSTIKEAVLQRNQFITHNNFPHKKQVYDENI